MIELKPSLKIRPALLIMLLLSLANMIVYWQMQHFEFLIYDDPAYVGVRESLHKKLNELRVEYKDTDEITRSFLPVNKVK